MLHILVDVLLWFVVVLEWVCRRFQMERFAQFNVVVFYDREIDIVKVLSVVFGDLLVECIFFLIWSFIHIKGSL